jgi:glycosyltransferase involved in cell wall biosynthesis
VINDGSTDQTGKLLLEYSDPRIRVFLQPNLGVSAARNVGVKHMHGDYLCFLDADDVLPERSLEARLKVMQQDDSITFVDGMVIYTDAQLNPTGEIYLPKFKGRPLTLLLRFSRKAFFGNTWMIRMRPDGVYSFDVTLNFCEDLFFYVTICGKSDVYSNTTEPVLFYRKHEQSSTLRLSDLETGYFDFFNKVKELLSINLRTRVLMKVRIKKVMFMTHLFDGGDIFKALKVLFR